MNDPMSSRFRKSGRVVERRIRDEHVLVPLGDGPQLDSVYVLDEIAARIWADATAGRTPEEIAGALAQDFDVEPATATADARRILTELVQIGALTEAG